MTEPTPTDTPTTEPPIAVTDSVIVAISSQLPNVSDEQVASVLQAWNTLIEGDPLGTIRLNSETGQLAHRVAVDGIHMWRITAPDGSTWTDMQATLPWTLVNQPTDG